MGGLVESIFGSGESTSTTTVTTAPPSAEELELIRLNTQLAQRQLQNIDNLQPFQQELIDLSLSELKAEAAHRERVLAAFTPEEQASMARNEAAMQVEQLNLARTEAERAGRLGPLQEELLNLQMEDLRRGGAATPEQIQRIKEATDAGIESGSFDIDRSTQRGIGMIADELANSRGLRLTDSPIMAEAGELVRGGEEMKLSLIKNLRAGEAAARLNHPLAVSQIMSGINMGQQNLADATKQFQAELRQRAFQNRLALSGQTSSSGIGLATVGSGVGASTLNTLTGTRSRTSSGTSFNPGEYLQGLGGFMEGVGRAGQAFSF